MKRYFSFLVALALVLCMVPAQLGFAEEPTVLTIGSVKELSAWDEHPVIQKICKEMNITIDLFQYDVDSFNILLAGGGLADIVIATSDYVTPILKNKIAKNIYPLLDEYAPNIKDPMYAPTIELVQLRQGIGSDELYMLSPDAGPSEVGGTKDPCRGYVLRWDYYKEIGCPEINNDDDYIAAIKAMQANHPETAEGKRTYGIAVERNLGDMGGYRGAFMKESSVNTWTFGSYMFKGDLTAPLTAPALIDGYRNTERSPYWVDMRFYNKVYREGLFDPDSFTLSYDEYNAKVATGAYMGLYFRSDKLYPESLKSDPNTLAGYMVIPSKGAISCSNRGGAAGSYPSVYSFIPEESKNWEIALAFLNKTFDKEIQRELWCGPKGEAWDYDENGEPYLFEETIARRNAGEDDVPGIHSLLQIMPYTNETIMDDGHMMDLFKEPRYMTDSLNPMEKDFCEYYGMNHRGELQQQYVEEGYTIDFRNDPALLAGSIVLPSDIKRILDACNDVCERAMPKLIMSETDEEFAEVQADVMEQLEDADVETAWSWVNEQWDVALETYGHLLGNKD